MVAEYVTAIHAEFVEHVDNRRRVFRDAEFVVGIAGRAMAGLIDGEQSKPVGEMRSNPQVLVRRLRRLVQHQQQGPFAPQPVVHLAESRGSKSALAAVQTRRPSSHVE